MRSTVYVSRRSMPSSRPGKQRPPGSDARVTSRVRAKAATSVMPPPHIVGKPSPGVGVYLRRPMAGEQHARCEWRFSLVDSLTPLAGARLCACWCRSVPDILSKCACPRLPSALATSAQLRAAVATQRQASRRCGLAWLRPPNRRRHYTWSRSPESSAMLERGPRPAGGPPGAWAIGEAARSRPNETMPRRVRAGCQSTHERSTAEAPGGDPRTKRW